jgi:hypothetical protein
MPDQTLRVPDDDASGRDASKAKVPYVAFVTFKNSFSVFDRHPPNQIDRTVWPSQSGAVQGQLLAAYRFLELIDDGGVPTEKLEWMLDPNEERRKAALARILNEAYPFLFQLDLKKTTAKQLSDALSQFGISGETLRKAEAFFLLAAKEAGIEVSSLLAKRTRRSPSSTGLRRKSSKAPRTSDSEPERADSSINGATASPVQRPLFRAEFENGDVLILSVLQMSLNYPRLSSHGSMK